ncbi:GntR family transcriptional regulator [Pseudochelatococcus sp. B33]
MTERPSARGIDRTPAYATIAAHLRSRIADGALPPGTVLLEGPLAEIFSLSRMPVQQALAVLETEGLVGRFKGRGLLVQDVNGSKAENASLTPRRVKITAQMLGLGESPATRNFAWETLYYEFERGIILNSVFGRFRVNELALARHFNVGRTVARDLLIQAQHTGIVQKGEKAHWWIVPLDRDRFRNLYELRVLLEPAALKGALPRMSEDALKAMERRVLAVIETYPNNEIAVLDRLENDLHLDCLGHSPNVEIMAALNRTQCLLVAGKHIQVALGRTPDPFMEEHLQIFRAGLDGDVDGACRALVAHLRASAEKAEERLESFHRSTSPTPPPYIVTG